MNMIKHNPKRRKQKAVEENLTYSLLILHETCKNMKQEIEPQDAEEENLTTNTHQLKLWDEKHIEVEWKQGYKRKSNWKEPARKKYTVMAHTHAHTTRPFIVKLCTVF